MRNEFCTLFDTHYLPRGLVLYQSLAAVCEQFRLRVICMDDNTKYLLDRLELAGLETATVSEVETYDPQLLRVKPTRSRIEYCWTVTPSVCLYVLETEPQLETITFLDADLMFYSDPRPLFDEFGGASIMLVPHRHAGRWRDLDGETGAYNSGTLTVRHDTNGLAALRWWRERCLEWCYNRIEDGRFGEQKYLDEFPRRFERVHVLQHPGGGVAPWNSGRYFLERRDACLLIDGVPVIFYHYQSFQLIHGMTILRRLGFRPRTFRLVPQHLPLTWTVAPWWRLDPRELALHWDEYAARVTGAILALRTLEPNFSGGIERWNPFGEAYYYLAPYVPPRIRRGVRKALHSLQHPATT